VIDTDMAEKILQGDDTLPVILQMLGLELLAEVKRLSEIEQEWLVMWATLEELNLVADVRKNMTLHGFVFPTDEDMEGDEEE
tara:strand:+ start:598 stop:843 length:246 start_codon:yes stop_codon:yes gene_type:complete